MKMEIHEPHQFLVIFILTLLSFPSFSFSQYYDDSPRNIEIYYPGWSTFPPPTTPPSPPPPPSPQPSAEPQPPTHSQNKTIITAVGVTAASALVAAALLLFFAARSKRSRKATGNPVANAREFVVDEEGLDAMLWGKLKASKGGSFKKLSVSLSRSRIHPSAVGDGGRRGTTVALQALPRQHSSLRSRALSEEEEGSPTGIDQASQYSEDATKAYIFGSLANNRTSATISDAEIFILDPTKSHNITIILNSLGIPLESLIDALLQGKGLSIEALEKLISAAPTSEEAAKILAFNGDQTRLAHAESFLYGLLKAFTPAFTRAHQMLFKLNYDSEMTYVKDSLQTLELACEELRSRGTFLSLLEAIHKAGTRLSVGNNMIEEAKSFNLNKLKKLCDYTSTDGNTSLLHFVVHQAIRNEGRRCVLARNTTISRQNSTRSQPSDDPEPSKEKKEKEYLMLGLPVIGGITTNFTNVKNATNVDCGVLKEKLDSLVNRVKEAKKLENEDDGGFPMDVRGFLESVELETKAAQVEYTRVIKILNKTAQYYQPGTMNDKNPCHLFLIVKDFLTMIDQTCVDVARSLQSESSQPDVLRPRVNFPKLPPHFFS